MDIITDLNYLKHHIILLIIVIILVIGSVYGIESIIAKHDAANSAKADAVLQQQTAQTNLLAQKLQQDELATAQQNAQLMAMNAQLSSYITQRDKAVAVVIQKDTTLSAVEAAQKIAMQTNAKPGEVIAQGDNVQMDLSVSRTVVANQDQLPVVQADLADTQKQLTSETTLYNGSQGSLYDTHQLIDAMKIQATDADNKCKADIKTAKAVARKSKLKWFSVGYVLGLVSAHFIGI
jgi:hypothetical protein